LEITISADPSPEFLFCIFLGALPTSFGGHKRKSRIGVYYEHYDALLWFIMPIVTKKLLETVAGLFDLYKFLR
jgi:hypothetical protein